MGKGSEVTQGPVFNSGCLVQKGTLCNSDTSLLVADLEPLAPPPTTIVSSFIVESSQALDSEFEAFQGQALTWQSQRHKVQRLSEML